MAKDKKNSQNEKLLFFRKFLQGGRSIASFTPSSRCLATAFCKHINPSRPQIILELGCGTGAVTEIAVAKMHADSKLVAIEADPDLAKFAQQRCTRANVLEGKAEQLMEILAAMQINKVDVVLNGLPTPSMPSTINITIYRACQELMADSTVTISQLTLMPWVYYKKYKNIFKHVDFQFVWQSIPPGGVYHCREFQPDFEKYL